MLHRITRALGMVCLLLLLLTAAPTTTSAQPPVEVRVNTTVDAPDANPGDGVCATATGQCSLRAAMQERIKRVFVPAGTYRLTIPGTGEDNSATGDLDFYGIRLIGEGPDRTIIDGNGLDRVLDVYADYDGGFVSNLTITGGHAHNTEDGGGVRRGELYSVIVRDNHADGNGGGVHSGNSNASLIINNHARNGGGISSPGIVSGTTITGNTAKENGGGIYYPHPPREDFYTWQWALNGATVTNNVSDSDKDDIGDGGGVYNQGSLILNESIIYGNHDTGGEAPNCSGRLSLNGLNYFIGNNIIGTLSGCEYEDYSFRSHIGVDPLLTSLQSNGSPIPSYVPKSGSPAIDGGFDGLILCSLTAPQAQQGVYILETLPCDIGAHETGIERIPYVTNMQSLDPSGRRQLFTREIVLGYSTAMYAFDGNSPYDIRNPDNYMLVADGNDGTFQTNQCQATQGDDRRIELMFTWDEDHYFYGLSLVRFSFANDLNSLPDDRYRLIICDSVRSHDGIQLDGNGDGIPGGHFIHVFFVNETSGARVLSPWTRPNYRGPFFEPNPLDTLTELSVKNSGVNASDPDNYRLISAGSDGVLQSSGCDNLSSLDRQLNFSLDNQTNLNFNFDSLTTGLYVFMACDSIVSSTGVPLDGDYDGNPGGDYLLNLRVENPPPIVNPGTQVHQVGEETWLQIRTGYNNWPRVYNYYTPAITGQATGLPPGLTVDTTTGLISGTPTTEGQFRTTISIPEWNVSETFDWLIVTTPSNLITEGELNAAPVKPTLSWTYASEHATYYHVYVQNSHGQAAVNQWFPAAEVCTGEVCMVTPTLPDHGLLNGEHQWWVGAYLANYDLTVYSGGGTYIPATFTLDVPSALKPTDFAVDENHGRPLLTWTHDPNSLWFQVYGGGAAMTDLRWHNANDLCTEGVCTLPMDFVTGTYDFWMQAWGPGGFSSVSGADGAASWLQADNAPLTLTPFNAGLPTDLTINADGTVTWTSGANATWYEVYVTTGDYAGVWALGWHAGMGIGCAAPSTTCTLSGQFDGELVSGQTYKIYIRAWGPGGFSDGGPFPSSPQWNEGTVIFTSDEQTR